MSDDNAENPRAIPLPDPLGPSIVRVPFFPGTTAPRGSARCVSLRKCGDELETHSASPSLPLGCLPSASTGSLTAFVDRCGRVRAQ